MDTKEYKCACGKEYADRTGLRKHKLKCNVLVSVDYKLEEKDKEIAMLNCFIEQDAKEIQDKDIQIQKKNIEIQEKDLEIRALKLALKYLGNNI
jgi:uncharacterized protein (DUF3084 family)